VPVAAGLTFATVEEAQSSPRGTMILSRCPNCGHVTNTAFDAALCPFDASYEAALFHSPTYVDYATGVVDRLVAKHRLGNGSAVLEIGSGSHVLLDRLTSLGCVATGVSEPAPPAGQFELALARFVLEHVSDPVELLRQLRAVARRVFVEVPDAGYDLTTAGWDLIYPHVHYLSAASLVRAATRAGWAVADVGTGFHSQYLWAELENTGSQAGTDEPFEPLKPSIDVVSSTNQWRERLAGRTAVVWGAGTRGTMFCNRVDPEATLIGGVVDRNPGKRGRFLPIAGQRVIAPAELAGLAPDLVVLTNPAYRSEITAELAELGVEAEVTVA